MQEAKEDELLSDIDFQENVEEDTGPELAIDDDSGINKNIIYQGIHFQKFDTATDNSYADFGKGALPKLTKVNIVVKIFEYKIMIYQVK